MEALFKEIASLVALGVEGAAALIIALGAIEAPCSTAKTYLRK